MFRCDVLCSQSERKASKFLQKINQSTQGGQDMSDKEKTILENLSKSLEKATDSQKEYLLGLADGMALMAEKKDKE